MYKTQTQIKLGARREKDTSSAHATSHHTHRSGPQEKFELNIFKRSKGSSPEPPVDDMVYRKSARLIVTIDIAFSTFLLVAHLITLISGGAHESTKSSSKYEVSSTATPFVQSESSITQKQRETLAVVVWMGMFAICILQLLVAGGTLGGTYERDGRKCIRNCRIWCVTTFFLVIVVILQLLAVLIFGRFQQHYVAIGLLLGEFILRTVGLVIINKFIKELSYEFADDMDNEIDERIFYEKLCPSPNNTAVTPAHTLYHL